MALIVPAILEETENGFAEKAKLIERLPEVKRIHVDFADGQFVSSKTLLIEEFDVLNPAFEWEAHLMVKEPIDFLDYKIAGFNTVTLHYEAFENIESLKTALQKIGEQKMKRGVAINPQTPVESLEAVIEFVDQITVMSVVPGFQGSPFEPNALEKIKELKAKYSQCIIEIDGSVNEQTLSEVIKSGPDLMVVGSAIVKAANPENSYQKLRSHLFG